jgi:iron(III) transport system ATP-binding protein
VRVLVRPAAVTLVPASDDAAHLRAVVRDVAFSGRGYEHVIELADGHRLTGIFAASRYERDVHVGVRLDADGCPVFPEREAIETGPPASLLEPVVTT